MSQVKLRTKGKNPGRGGRMDQVVLQKTVLAAFKLRCCDLEKRCGITHGMAVKMRAKIRCLHLSETQVAAMTPNELYALWYKRALTKVKTSPDGSILRQRYLEPDYKALQKAFIATSQHDGSRHERKIKKTKHCTWSFPHIDKRSVQDLNLRAKENLVRRISSPVHYHSANTP